MILEKRHHKIKTQEMHADMRKLGSPQKKSSTKDFSKKNSALLMPLILAH